MRILQEALISRVKHLTEELLIIHDYALRVCILRLEILCVCCLLQVPMDAQ